MKKRVNILLFAPLSSQLTDQGDEFLTKNLWIVVRDNTPWWQDIEEYMSEEAGL